MTVKLGFDVGGVLSKYPKILRPIIYALQFDEEQLHGAEANEAVEVHILSDMPIDTLRAMLTANAIYVPPDRIHSCDYALHGERCKAVKAAELGLDVLVDDFPGYLAVPGAPALRLLAMPDADRDYYDPTWVTSGAEGGFGRHHQKRAAEEAGK